MSGYLQGLSDVIENIQNAVDKLKKKSTAGLKDAVLFVGNESQQRAPVDMGDLRGSLEVRIDNKKIADGIKGGGINRVGNVPENGTVGEVSYNEPYAAVQHERVDFKHPKGGEAKYLEKVLTGEKDMMLQSQNITAVTYSNGSEMPVSKYAAMTARSTTAEAQNTAKTAQGTDWGYDLVRMTEHTPTCPICSQYQGRVYATTPDAASGKYKTKDGTALTFPYLYDTAFASGYMTIHPNCRHRISVFPPAAYTDEELTKHSQRSSAPFEDTRSDAERKAYAEDQAKKRKRNEMRKQYEKIKQALPDQAPKSFAGFVRMKAANSQRYQDLIIFMI